MKLKTLSALCLAASTMAMTSTAMAWESEDGNWSTSANVALSSDYIFRGVSQTDKDPSISGGFDVAHSSGLYVGTWASNVDYDNENSLEIDYYAGFAGEFGDSGVSFDVGGLYYDFPEDSASDTMEWYGSVGYSFLSAGIAYSNDWLGSDEDSIYYSIDAAYDIAGFTLAAGIGWNTFDDSDADYENYYVGISREFAGFGFDLTYHDASSEIDSDVTDTFVFTISKSM
jgi:uncharacterized protein (TIGR02001 family)